MSKNIKWSNVEDALRNLGKQPIAFQESPEWHAQTMQRIKEIESENFTLTDPKPFFLTFSVSLSAVALACAVFINTSSFVGSSSTDEASIAQLYSVSNSADLFGGTDS